MTERSKPFKLVVTGSRDFRVPASVFDRLMEKTLWQMSMLRAEFNLDKAEPTLLVAEGGAAGADEMVRDWVKRRDTDQIEHSTYKADWTKHGLKAGPLRNAWMLADFQPEMVLAIWDGRTSRSGTLDCMKKACDLGIPIIVEPMKGRK